MIIEFVGAPGAGKTTLLPIVIEFFQERGMEAFTVVDAARPFAERTVLGRIVLRLAPAAWSRPLLWQVFYRLSVLYRVKFLAKHPGLIRHVFNSQRGRPSAADVHQRKVLFWFIRLIGYYEFLKTHAAPNEVLILDEGFTHRVVQLYASSVEEPDRDQIRAYVERIPQPDLVVFVRVSRQICEERIYSRGLWKRFQQKTPSEITQFVTNAHRAVALVVDAVKSKGWPVIEIPNESDDLAATEAELRHQLAQTTTSTGKALVLQTA